MRTNVGYWCISNSLILTVALARWSVREESFLNRFNGFPFSRSTETVETVE
jgi:hypothetical protein